MRKKRFNVEQMIGVLKQAPVGIPVAELMRTSRLVWRMRLFENGVTGTVGRDR